MTRSPTPGTTSVLITGEAPAPPPALDPHLPYLMQIRGNARSTVSTLAQAKARLAACAALADAGIKA